MNDLHNRRTFLRAARGRGRGVGGGGSRAGRRGAGLGRPSNRESGRGPDCADQSAGRRPRRADVAHPAVGRWPAGRARGRRRRISSIGRCPRSTRVRRSSTPTAIADLNRRAARKCEGERELRGADAGAAGRTAPRHREDAVLPGRALRHDRRHLRAADVGRQSRLRRLAHARLRAPAALPAAVRLLRRRRSTGGADMAAGSRRAGARAFGRATTVDFVIVGSGAAGGIIAKELVDRRATRSSCSNRARGSPRRSSITTSSARSCRASNANNPATQPQTFRATPHGHGAERRWRSIYGRLVGGSNAHFTAQLLAAPPERFQRGAACSAACRARRWSTGRSPTTSSSRTTRRPNGSWASRASRDRSIRRDRGPIRCRRCR